MIAAIVWLLSLASVFLIGWAWGRSGRRVVVVNFPERPALNALKPTLAEVAAAMRKADSETGTEPAALPGSGERAAVAYLDGLLAHSTNPLLIKAATKVRAELLAAEHPDWREEW